MNWKETVDELKARVKAYEATGDENAQTAKLMKAAAAELACARNELCLKCGEYKQRYLSACGGCRWK